MYSFSLPNNMDKKTNKYGRSLNEICISNDLYFLNGRTRGDNSGKFTFHQFNEANVADYAIVSSCLLDKIIYLVFTHQITSHVIVPFHFVLRLDHLTEV